MKLFKIKITGSLEEFKIEYSSQQITLTTKSVLMKEQNKKDTINSMRI